MVRSNACSSHSAIQNCLTLSRTCWNEVHPFEHLFMTAAGSSSASKGKPIVFVVDDDVSVRESLELLIQFEGWQPETFASAEEFLARPLSLIHISEPTRLLS